MLITMPDAVSTMSESALFIIILTTLPQLPMP